MLAGQNTLAAVILALPPVDSEIAGMTQFVNAIADYMDQVQAGPTGNPGIFSLNRPVVISMLSSLPNVSDSSWISGFADAWEAGVTNGTITPGTVTNPAWIGSVVDVETSPSPSSTIDTISSAKSTLMSELQAATYKNNPPHPFSIAITDATLQFIFTCIGLGPPPTFIPIPIPIPAE